MGIHAKIDAHLSSRAFHRSLLFDQHRMPGVA